jgi:signal transduction histidine kinase
LVPPKINVRGDIGRKNFSPPTAFGRNTKDRRLVFGPPESRWSAEGGLAVDTQRLGYAVRNLLDYAVTYSTPGGQITLLASSEGSKVTLSVVDTG